MDESVKPLTRALTYAGGLPFAALAALAAAHRAPWGLDPVAALRAYSLVIAAFMAGSVWGYALREPEGGPWLIVSNVVALAVFFAALDASPRVALGVDLLAFLALLAVDARARARGWLDPAYLDLRIRITSFVAVALAVAWVAL